MKLPQDFREFLELFNAKGVEYMVVGSYALAYWRTDSPPTRHHTQRRDRRVWLTTLGEKEINTP